MSAARDERLIFQLRPSWFAAVVVFAPFLLPALFLLGAWAVLKFLLMNNFPPALTISLWMISLSLVLGTLLRWSRSYTLTNRRMTAVAGLIRRSFGEVPLRNVQHISMTRSLVERLTGTGTISVSTAGSDGPTLTWIMVPEPEVVISAIRAAVDKAQGEPLPTVPVIGLVGGIGAGKSAVAKALGKLGCLVIDSDADVRAVLTRPDVIAKLVEWWGPSILDASGAPDRKRIGEIVFSDPAERRRLEELVHPMVKADRSTVIRRAAETGRTGVVIDAPLLFEAGSDAECDLVIFVDAPREMREARVKSRGWTPEEMTRREAAQMAIDEKKQRSDLVVVNDGDLSLLESRVKVAFGEVLDRVGRGAGRRGR